MNQNDIHKLIEKQRAYFYSNETLNIEKRIHALKKLKTCLLYTSDAADDS